MPKGTHATGTLTQRQSLCLVPSVVDPHIHQLVGEHARSSQLMGLLVYVISIFYLVHQTSQCLYIVLHSHVS